MLLALLLMLQMMVLDGAGAPEAVADAAPAAGTFMHASSSKLQEGEVISPYFLPPQNNLLLLEIPEDTQPNARTDDRIEHAQLLPLMQRQLLLMHLLLFREFQCFSFEHWQKAQLSLFVVLVVQVFRRSLARPALALYVVRLKCRPVFSNSMSLVYFLSACYLVSDF